MRTRGKRLRVAGAIVALAAAAPIVAATALPAYYWRGTAISLAYQMPGSFSAEPLGVAFLGLCAGILMARGRVLGRRWLAAGMLLAFGVQTVLLFWGYQFAYSPPNKPGSAGFVGMVGGVLLVAAGVLGAAGIAADRAAPDQTGRQGISDSPSAF